MQLIKNSGAMHVTDGKVSDLMIDGFRAIMNGGPNPSPLGGMMSVRITPIMGEGENRVFLAQLVRSNVVIACGSVDQFDL